MKDSKRFHVMISLYISHYLLGILIICHLSSESQIFLHATFYKVAD